MIDLGEVLCDLRPHYVSARFQDTLAGLKNILLAVQQWARHHRGNVKPLAEPWQPVFRSIEHEIGSPCLESFWAGYMRASMWTL